MRFPSIFRKHIQRFISFLGWFFSTLVIKVKLSLLAPNQPAAQGLGKPHTSAPQTPARGDAVPRGQKPLALTTRRDAGGVRTVSLPPHPKSSTQLWPERQGTHGEKVRGGVEGGGKKSLRREGLVG